MPDRRTVPVADGLTGDVRRAPRVPPPATLVLFLVTVVVFIGQLRGDDWKQAAGIIPANITGHTPVEQFLPAWLTLFSYQFLHGGAVHLLANALSLWVFGIYAEPLMGARRFALVYLVSGVVAGLVIVALIPHWTQPMVGASGSICGILGTVLALRFAEKRSRLTVLEAIPPLAVAAWWLTRTEPPEPDRASSAAWHLIPFLLAWYCTRLWVRLGRNPA